ncbi:plasma membrane copper transporter complex subunit Ctr4 [Schizosaccharomyces osmophilus]|uniref:Copper transport protein n=1 Tax=Schizosaccharomyces osmophilus TaxID=2545709 RepID=A0AAE9WIR6_9SCHI|nr:plasma membrane copper transporter complex subunit Ctr4 [Schizosaccharomyces osmophilus]WBW74978.1 plasma membrane copper transporter complex subunit Ctr4 [Schizosaccharomyces osmophilus]
MSFLQQAKENMGDILIHLGGSLKQQSDSLLNAENDKSAIEVFQRGASKMSNSAMGGMSNMTNSSTSSSSTASSTGASCKTSMYWNWYTIDACFITKHWHIRSKGMFVGSIFGIIFMMMALELVHRLQREFDRWCIRQSQNRSNHVCHHSPESSFVSSSSHDLSWFTRVCFHFIRSCLYIIQFIVTYIAMLLAMYYNGYVILFLFCGTFLGFFLFAADTVTPNEPMSNPQINKIVHVSDEKDLGFKTDSQPSDA